MNAPESLGTDYESTKGHCGKVREGFIDNQEQKVATELFPQKYSQMYLEVCRI